MAGLLLTSGVVFHLSMAHRRSRPFANIDFSRAKIVPPWDVEQLIRRPRAPRVGDSIESIGRTVMRIDVSGDPVGDSWLQRTIPFNRDITSLDLGGTLVSDAGLELLKSLKNLESLHLHGTLVTDAGLVSLKSHPKLQELWLDETQVTDAGLQSLKLLPSLRHLSLGGNYIPPGPRGFVEAGGGGIIEAHLFMQRLGRHGCVQITDAGLEHVLEIPSLRSLQLYGTSVTWEAVKRLKQERPSVRISGP